MEEDVVNLRRLILQNELKPFRGERDLTVVGLDLRLLQGVTRGGHFDKFHVICVLQDLLVRLFCLFHLLAIVSDVNVEEVFDDALPSFSRVLFQLGHVFASASFRFYEAKLQIFRHHFKQVCLETQIQREGFLEVVALRVSLDWLNLRHRKGCDRTYEAGLSGERRMLLRFFFYLFEQVQRLQLSEESFAEFHFRLVWVTTRSLLLALSLVPSRFYQGWVLHEFFSHLVGGESFGP